MCRFSPSHDDAVICLAAQSIRITRSLECPGTESAIGDLSQYHLSELAIARDPRNRAFVMPPLKPHYRRVLDVGCGMGQTLFAANLPPEVVGYGVDPDASAIEAGRRVAPANVRLSVGQGESLEFADNFFDLVICRVALPYMHIARSLSEMHRVLKPGGETWLVLHPMSLHWERTRDAIRKGSIKGIAACAWIGMNSMFSNTLGVQLTVRGRTETFQTVGGIRRALVRAGFECTRIEHTPFFVAEARRPAPARQS